MKRSKGKIIFLLLMFLIIFLFTLIFILNKRYPFLFKTNKKNVIVLAYHHFVLEPEKKKYYANNSNVISVNKFEKQLKYLKTKKYNTITSEELYCWLEKKCKLPEKSILITIDDGNLSTYKYALPLLEKYNFNAISFVISSRMKKTTGKWKNGELVFMGEDLINDIIKNHQILEIASHTHDLHRKIDGVYPKKALPITDLEKDIIKSKKILKTNNFAYPFGSYNDKYIKALKNVGFQMAFTYKDSRSVQRPDNLFEIPRIAISGDITMLKFKQYLKSK